MRFISIEGVIGVGKTTLARYLHQELDAKLVLEVFEENPFLSAFYRDRDRYAFQTQMFFLLSRYHQMKQLANLPPPIVSDYMFAKDKLFAEQTLQGDELAMYKRVYDALSETSIRPDLVIYLRADTPVLMSRIAFRDRPYERNMDEDYIDGLRKAYEQFFVEYPDHAMLTVDTNELNIVDNEEHRRDVLRRIINRIGDGPRQQTLPGLDARTRSVDAPVEVAGIVPTEEAAVDGLQSLLNMLKLQQQIGMLAAVLQRQHAGEDDSPPIEQLYERLQNVYGVLNALAQSLGYPLSG